MGFNNKGATNMLNALSKNYPKGKRGMPVGVNIGKAKTTPLDRAVDDYLACFRKLADQADYFTINHQQPKHTGAARPADGGLSARPAGASATRIWRMRKNWARPAPACC